MLTEIPVHHEQTNQRTEFITPLSAYQEYQHMGGLLSMRAWVEAQNTGIDFQSLRSQFPPQGQDPFSRYLQFGGNINPALFYQVNPDAFQFYQEYNPRNPRYADYLRPTLFLDTAVPAEPDPLITALERQHITPPSEVSHMYFRLAALDSSLTAVGSPEQIHLELGQISNAQRLIDSARMVSALTYSEGYVHYAREVAAAMEMRPAMQPWNLTDTHLHIETCLMQGRREEAEALKASLKPRTIVQ